MPSRIAQRTVSGELVENRAREFCERIARGHVDDIAVGAVSAVEIANADRRAFGCEEIGCGLTDAAGTTGDRHYGAFGLDLRVAHYGLLPISNTDAI